MNFDKLELLLVVLLSIFIVITTILSYNIGVRSTEQTLKFGICEAMYNTLAEQDTCREKDVDAVYLDLVNKLLDKRPYAYYEDRIF